MSRPGVAALLDVFDGLAGDFEPLAAPCDGLPASLKSGVDGFAIASRA
jgi:hypothetical protein